MSKEPRRRRPDARASAGDDRNPVREIGGERHPSGLLGSLAACSPSVGTFSPAARREVERTLHPNWAGRSRIATGRSGVLVFAARRQANHRRKVYAGQRLSFRTAGQARSLINGVQSPGQNRTPGNPTVRDRRAALRTVTSTADGLLVRALNFEPDNRTHSSTGGDWKRNATASPRQPPTQPCSATTWWITRNVRVSRSSPGK